MAIVSDHCHIVMDTDVDNAIYVLNDDGTYICFQQTKRNIYCMHIGDATETEHCYFTTVKGMEMQYSPLDRKRAIAVQSLKEHLLFPSNIDLANTIDYNILGTYQFNQRDIQIANKIYGPSVAAIKGKSTKRPNKMDQSDIVTEIPRKLWMHTRKYIWILI